MCGNMLCYSSQVSETVTARNRGPAPLRIITATRPLGLSKS